MAHPDRLGSDIHEAGKAQARQAVETPASKHLCRHHAGGLALSLAQGGQKRLFRSRALVGPFD